MAANLNKVQMYGPKLATQMLNLPTPVRFSQGLGLIFQTCLVEPLTDTVVHSTIIKCIIRCVSIVHKIKN